MKKKNETKRDAWVFLPVHKTRIIKELDNATLLKVDYDRTTILPRVFRRIKETKDFIYYSLPNDFNANIRVSVQNLKTRRYEHTDSSISVQKLVEECGLDKPYKELGEEEQEFVGENVEDTTDEPLPF